MRGRGLSGLIFILLFSLPALGFSQSEEEAREKFQKLKSDFEEEISYPPYSDYSYPERKWDCDSGRAIVAMGKEALPFVIEEIGNDNRYFTVAATRITGIKMWGPESEDLKRDWLNWWQDNRDDPKWNPFIESSDTESPDSE